MPIFDVKQITLEMVLNDPAPPDFDRPPQRTPIVGAICRGCGWSFLDTNGKRLCDACLVDRVNGAGELEDDDPDDAIDRVPPWASADAAGLWAIVRDYWRGEVRAEPAALAALARLERVCRERGYDYRQTVLALAAVEATRDG